MKLRFNIPLFLGASLIVLLFLIESGVVWFSTIFPQSVVLQIGVIDLNALKAQARLLGKDAVLYARVYWPFRPGLRRIVFYSSDATMSLLVIGPSGLLGNCTTPCSLAFKQSLPYVFFEVYVYSLEPKKEVDEYHLVIRIAGSE